MGGSEAGVVFGPHIKEFGVLLGSNVSKVEVKMITHRGDLWREEVGMSCMSYQGACRA